jgi:hypothetical protein
MISSTVCLLTRFVDALMGFLRSNSDTKILINCFS